MFRISWKQSWCGFNLKTYMERKVLWIWMGTFLFWIIFKKDFQCDQCLHVWCFHDWNAEMLHWRDRFNSGDVRVRSQSSAEFILFFFFNLALYIKSDRWGFNLRRLVRVFFFVVVPRECCGTEQNVRFGFSWTRRWKHYMLNGNRMTTVEELRARSRVGPV